MKSIQANGDTDTERWAAGYVTVSQLVDSERDSKQCLQQR